MSDLMALIRGDRSSTTPSYVHRRSSKFPTPPKYFGQQASEESTKSKKKADKPPKPPKGEHRSHYPIVPSLPWMSSSRRHQASSSSLPSTLSEGASHEPTIILTSDNASSISSSQLYESFPSTSDSDGDFYQPSSLPRSTFRPSYSIDVLRKQSFDSSNLHAIASDGVYGSSLRPSMTIHRSSPLRRMQEVNRVESEHSLGADGSWDSRIQPSASSSSSAHEPTPPVQDAIMRMDSPPPAYTNTGRPNSAILHQLEAKVALTQYHEEHPVHYGGSSGKPTPESMGISFPREEAIDESTAKPLPRARYRIL
ncbi:hypothetical protein FRB91_011495 [Serendipita sp. 411]|nr:hypothetical protein FRB91_011495 [Serendipita sp. 411]